MSAVRLAGEGLLVEVSIEPRLTEDGLQILLVTIVSDRTGAEWTTRVALGHERDPAGVVVPTVLNRSDRASRQDIFETPTPNRPDREIRERSRSRDRNGMWGL